MKESDKQSTKQPIWAICVTGGWLLLGVIYLVFHFDAIWNDPNELGDFLAGFFSPLAFLWLVIGYFQQQKELNLNTKALNLQKEELKRTGDQVKRQADHMEQQALRSKRALVPILNFRELTYSEFNTTFENIDIEFQNSGGRVDDARMVWSYDDSPLEINLCFRDQKNQEKLTLNKGFVGILAINEILNVYEFETFKEGILTFTFIKEDSSRGRQEFSFYDEKLSEIQQLTNDCKDRKK